MTTTTGPLEPIARRYDAAGSTWTAQAIREAAQNGGDVLLYRALSPFGRFTLEAMPCQGMTPRDVWNEIERTDANAYDSPRFYRGTLGPFAI